MMIDDGSPLDQLLRCCSSWSRLSHGYYALLTIILNKVTKKGKNIPVRDSQLLQGNYAVDEAPGVSHVQLNVKASSPTFFVCSQKEPCAWEEQSVTLLLQWRLLIERYFRMIIQFLPYHEILGHSGHEHVLSIKLQVSGLFKQEHCCTMLCESVSIITNKTKRL